MNTIPGDFDPIPSTRYRPSVGIGTLKQAMAEADALAVPVSAGAEPAEELGTDAAGLASAGFTAQRGQTLVRPTADGPVRVAVGTGTPDQVDTTLVRDLAAEFARAVPWHRRLAIEIPSRDVGISVSDYAQAATEGVLLARWRYFVGRDADRPLLESLLVVASDEQADEVAAGVQRGRVIAEAYCLGRDLSNCPASTLSAVRMAEVALEVGPPAGLEVEVFDKDQLIELGCGGLLGVNRGSVEPPRMIRLRYQPEQPTGRIALIGKGIMYDSGGISLKPSDESHAQMKNDMTGAAAVLASMTALRALGCTAAVTGYLMCTDNMPSGSALKLGDVLRMRNGTTVEVLNTDAEGRLVMADALALATEEPVDAIVDIATLTGACLRTFGVEIAGVMGNDRGVVEQLRRAGDAVDEPVWELPLHRSYRSQLDSPIADLTNMGGVNAGSITAALFLEEFVDGRPWAHVDIAGTAQLPQPRTWRNKGATGSGTKLLIEFALAFNRPASLP
ncbi:leucyl aminopeptidase [Kribbella sp. VKM Ac-2569]|uniref:leucyl aminopeptidase family protein n=1 Tax=Kribbella sp. VKM Ac-2569 TaxID=2512220 RepID=UPI0010D18E4F|nr:leucyl aminopeptidase [Kribbella sp. VKM Ac-2569]RZT07527.1 leucyl aminopeptidase [Kribbella sp. VKM Ac-2569]